MRETNQAYQEDSSQLATEYGCGTSQEKEYHRIVKMDGDVQLIVPSGCRATVLLRRVDDGKCIRYSWLAIQYALADTCVSASYTHTSGEDTVQVHLDEGTPLSSETVEAQLTGPSRNAGDPPIVIDKM